MRVGKKMMVVLSVLATGASSAFFFRKDNQDVDSAADGGLFGQRVERRVPAGAAWVRKMNAQQALHAPPPTTASIAAESGASEPTFQKTFNPVGTLLGPIDGAPAGDESNEPIAAYQAQQASAGPDGVRTHVVTDGDTLSRLAAQYLGRADRYLEIFEFNRPLLSSPDLLPIGAALKIPPRAAGQRETQPSSDGGTSPDDAPAVTAPLKLVPVPRPERP